MAAKTSQSQIGSLRVLFLEGCCGHKPDTYSNNTSVPVGRGVPRVRSHPPPPPTVTRGPLFLLTSDQKQSDVEILFYSNLLIM